MMVTDLGILGLVTGELFHAQCTACSQQIQGSSFLTNLNQAPTASGVKYVVIQTSHDDVVAPYKNALLPAKPNAQNITLQSRAHKTTAITCPHPYDANALQDMINALGPDKGTSQPACAAVGPIFGNVRRRARSATSPRG